jgi:hypothetical protein
MITHLQVNLLRQHGFLDESSVCIIQPFTIIKIVDNKEDQAYFPLDISGLE